MTALPKRSITSTLAASAQGRGILNLPDPSRAWVSSRSRFGDEIWWLDIATPGQSDGAGRLDWGFVVADGLLFSHQSFETLRDTLRRFVWSLFCERVNGLPLTGGSVLKVQTGVSALVRWMFRNDYVELSELNSSASEEYLEDIQEEYKKSILTEPRPSVTEQVAELASENEESAVGMDDVEIGQGHLRPRLQIWAHLWGQREVMLRFGQDALPEAPFSGRSVRSLSDELATKVEGWIPPVPDEVALPVMREARRWLYERADDIVALHDMYLDAYDESDGYVEAYRTQLAGKIFEKFAFSADKSTGNAWRGPVAAGSRSALSRSGWRQPYLKAPEVLRALIEDLCAACVIVIQSEAGLRVNEMCGLRAGSSSVGSIAYCIKQRVSKTGLNENFFLQGLLSKLQNGPREVEWLLGSRPTDSTELPAPVRAVWVLERLYKKLRERTPIEGLRDALIVRFTATRGYPRSGVSIGRMTTVELRLLQRQFVGNNVDLSALSDRNKNGEDLAKYRDTNGACLLTHSWRKTFALHMFRTDSRMTPAIAQQFHHLSLAMTEEGYLGTDPTLLEVIDSVHQEQSALIFYEFVNGERPAAGRMAKLVDEYREELADLLKGTSREEGLQATRRWAVREDFRIWFSNHGKCFFKVAPNKSRCHELGDSKHWANSEPNFAFRTPDACLGCPLYAVDHEHEVFWRTRLLENIRWLNAGSARGGARMVAEFRVRQSRAVLRAIGVEIEEKEQQDV